VHIEHGKSLVSLNTFGFEQKAEHYVEVANDDELAAMVAEANRRAWPVFILGGGSNLVLTKDLPGLVIRQTQEDITYTQAGTTDALTDGCHVSASAGTEWHKLVIDTLARGYQGLENLSLIPGSCGAAPVQNIGAYGVELADRLVSLHALHLASETWQSFDMSDCNFAYRDSVFKHRRGEFAITRITLQVGGDIALETAYASLAQALAEQKLQAPDAADISRTVCAIRRARLPDPASIGNAGSFFHNPVVSRVQADALQARFPNLVAYHQNDGSSKLAAGWLIDSLGYRGCRQGAVGVHSQQALVLLNHGGGNGRQLMDLAAHIAAAVRDRYDVVLLPEPLVI
jgi:UDP-N-acetylmuramate dehydrogenase